MADLFDYKCIELFPCETGGYFTGLHMMYNRYFSKGNPEGEN